MEPAQNEVDGLHVVTIRHDMSATEFVHWKGKNLLYCILFNSSLRSSCPMGTISTKIPTIDLALGVLFIYVRTYVLISNYGTSVKKC